MKNPLLFLFFSIILAFSYTSCDRNAGADEVLRETEEESPAADTESQETADTESQETEVIKDAVFSLHSWF